MPKSLGNFRSSSQAAARQSPSASLVAASVMAPIRVIAHWPSARVRLSKNTGPISLACRLDEYIQRRRRWLDNPCFPVSTSHHHRTIRRTMSSRTPRVRPAINSALISSRARVGCPRIAAGRQGKGKWGQGNGCHHWSFCHPTRGGTISHPQATAAREAGIIPQLT